MYKKRGKVDMRAVLKFDLYDQEDKQRYQEMLQASDVLSFIHDWEQQLRYWRKHADKEPTFDEIDDKYFELKGEADIRTW